MKVYRVTRVANRPVYGTWRVGAKQTKVVTKRSLSGIIKAAAPGQGSYNILKIEEAEVGEFTDVTEAYIHD